MSQGWDWGDTGRGVRARMEEVSGGCGKPEEVPGPAWGAGVVREGFLEKGMHNLKPIRKLPRERGGSELQAQRTACSKAWQDRNSCLQNPGTDM